MKFSIALLVLLAVVCCLALDDSAPKKTDKRGLFGLGYGYHGGPYYGGHQGYDYAHSTYSHGHSHYPPYYYGHGYHPYGYGHHYY